MEMKLVDIVCLDALTPELEANDRNGAIAELVSALDKAGKLGKGNAQKVVRTVIKRENEASTGLGKGVAVPHVKHTAVKKVVAAVGKSAAGLDFSALDKQPVYSIILLVSPANDPAQHLEAMENIFAHLQKEKFRSFLQQAGTAEEIAELLRDADEDPSL
jgi:mannitol/fructose-specific phosphotransferase system IIA component (Ntr-type)